MLDLIAFFCLCGAVLILMILSVIDMKIRLLPNEWVLGFATTGGVFHLTTIARYMEPQEIILGALVGFGSLYLIRAAANWHYKQDALGLGDVKLMGAAGIWLGMDGTLFALTLGALAGLIHGITYGLYIAWKDQTPINLRRLEIPAGPGFAVGIALVGGWLYHSFVLDFFHDLFA